MDDKRLRVDIAAIREFIKTKDIYQIKWCAGDIQLANLYDKTGGIRLSAAERITVWKDA